MLEKFVSIALVLGVVGGVAGMLSVPLWPTSNQFNYLPEPERSSRKQKRLAVSLHTFSISAAGLVLLLGHFSSPLEILIGVIAVRGMFEVGVRNWKPKTIISRERCFAFDAKTGAQLGEVVRETRNWSNGAIEAFTIRTGSGELVEHSADAINIHQLDSSSIV